MTARVLDFYFDYLSPYAYFSWRQLRPLCQRYGVELHPHPVVFGKLLDHWGQLGPAEIAPKKAALYKYCYRYATLHGFEFNPPRFHPYNPLPSLRLSLLELCGERQTELIDRLFCAAWSEGADLASTSELTAILNSAGFEADSLLAAIETPEAKQALQRETEQAIAQGVFGVPTFIVDGELFWGNDQLEHLEIFLQGNDPLDAERVEAMLARHRGIDRKKTAKRIQDSQR
ncbi:MAG: 2-hydroxychromene-2-carboxylate isomerase [Halopseudomonas sp.]